MRQGTESLLPKNQLFFENQKEKPTIPAQTNTHERAERKTATWAGPVNY